MGEYRPISCCNVIYKCITKVLVNRLLPGLDEVISPNQGAFIPHRSIAENVLLAQALVSEYHMDMGVPRCTLKIDLMKAYDSVDWEFILHCLACFGAPSNFIGWIRSCNTSPSFSIALNDTLVGFFHGRKGLRQGDRLSPYLFVLAMEVLSCLLGEATSTGSGFQFHPKCSSLKLTHLCFADDLLLFSAANLSSLRVIHGVLEEFEELSGLKSNPAKSSVFVADLELRAKQVLLDFLQIPEGSLPVRYLGLLSYLLDCRLLIVRVLYLVLLLGLIHGWSSISLLPADYNSLLQFFLACKYIGQGCSFLLRKSSL